MSISVGNNSVVTNGLILHIDPGNNRNYLLSEVEVLVVAGGGAGGQDFAGGGGGGGVVYNTSYPVTPGNAITVTVGNGGTRPITTGAVNGQNSVFGNITAIGGGGGGGSATGNAGSGGSGGGAAGGFAKGLGTVGQGFDGESASITTTNAAGGGGAGGSGFGGNGGPGLPFTISGSLRYYAGGGGGCGGPGIYFKGGIGGGGTSSGFQTGDGTPNTGGGGAAFYGSWGGAGNGGSGIVIVRYPGPQKATGGNTITSVGGYTIHTFTSSGTFTPNTAPTNGSAIYGLQDLSNNCNTAFAVNGPTYTSDGSIFFDGINDKLNCGRISQLGPNLEGLTVSAWFMPYINRTSILLENGTNYFTNTFYLAQENDTQLTFEVWGTSYDAAVITNPVPYPINVWINLVGVWRRDIPCKLYYNGVDNSVPWLNSTPQKYLIAGNTDLFVGARPPGNDMSFFGKISNIAIYNRALSAAEIQQNFNALRSRYGV